MALTLSDIKRIQSLLGNEFGRNLKLIFSHIDQSQSDLKTVLEEKIKHLPTKDEYFANEDKMVTELKAIRDELETLTYRVSQHSDKLASIPL